MSSSLTFAMYNSDSSKLEDAWSVPLFQFSCPSNMHENLGNPNESFKEI